MKKNLIGKMFTMASVMLVSLGLYAQGPGMPPPPHQGDRPMMKRGHGPNKDQKMIKQALKGIILSDAQAGKITGITSRFKDEMKEVQKASSEARKEFKKACMDESIDEATLKTLADKCSDGMLKTATLRRKMVQEIKSVLTDEQKTVFDKNIAEMKEKAKRHMNKKGKGKGKGRGNRKGKGKMHGRKGR